MDGHCELGGVAFEVKLLHKMVQLNFTQEMEIICMLFDRAHSTFTMTSIKKHIEYFNFKSKIQLDHSVTSVIFIALV